MMTFATFEIFYAATDIIVMPVGYFILFVDLSNKGSFRIEFTGFAETFQIGVFDDIDHVLKLKSA